MFESREPLLSSVSRRGVNKMDAREPWAGSPVLGETQASDCPQDLKAGGDAADNVAGDLRFSSRSSPVGNGRLLHAESAAQGLDLHFNGPTIVAILHREPAESVATDRPKWAQVGIAITEEHTDQADGKLVAEPLVRRQRSWFSPAEFARADHQVSLTTTNGLQENGRFVGPIAAV